MLRSRLRRGVAVAAALVFAGACADEFAVDPPDGFVAYIDSVGWPDELVVGDTVTLRTDVRESATGTRVDPAGLDWIFAPASALELIEANGDSARFRVAAIGDVLVTARLDDPAFDTASVSVMMPSLLAGIAIESISEDTLRQIGDTAIVRVRALDANGEAFAASGFSWTVRGDAVVVAGSSALDSLRIVSAANGTAWVIAAHAQCSGTCRDSVQLAVEQTIAQITLPDTIRINSIGASAVIRAQVRDDAGTIIPGASVTFTQVDGVGIVALSDSTVTALGPGSARIVASAGGVSDTVQVVVSQVVASISIAPSTADTLSVGDSLRLTAIVRDSGGTAIPGASVVWVSNDTAIVGIDASGKLTARALGATTIRAVSGNAFATFSLTVASFALAFDGADLLEVANAPALVLDSAFTIELWVRPQSTTGGALVATWNGSKAGSSYALYLRGLVPRAYIRGAGTGNTPTDSVTATTALVPGTWSHVAFVYDHGVGTLYVNGVLSGTSLLMAHPNPATVPLRVGAEALGSPTFLTGDVDEIRIWHRARSAAEILTEQLLRLPSGSSGLAVYYPLYLGAGDPVDIVGGLVAARGGPLGAGAAPAWIVDGSSAP